MGRAELARVPIDRLKLKTRLVKEQWARWKLMRMVVATSVFLALGIGTALTGGMAVGGCPSGSSSKGRVSNVTTTGRYARSIILFIGDGMGQGHRTAGRWSRVGKSDTLAMDAMPFSGWSRTSSADGAITDSAAAATALATGVKTDNGMVAVDPQGKPLKTILEWARARGKAVGLVTTTQIADATPASFAAHVQDRSQKTEIARQMLAARVDVLLGGGEDDFLPATAAGCYPQPGRRSDGRNLIAEATASGYTYVCSLSALAVVDRASTTQLLGLFADEGMVRPFSPSLVQMTQKAIDILSRDPDGFFLMVEGGQIDWASHGNDATSAIDDTVGLDEAVAAAKAYAATAGDTLIVVTADHETGGMSVSLTPTGATGEDGPFSRPDGTPFYVNWTTPGHTPADVPTTAQGPRAELLSGTYDNTQIYGVMLSALDWRVWLPSVGQQWSQP